MEIDLDIDHFYFISGVRTLGAQLRRLCMSIGAPRVGCVRRIWVSRRPVTGRKRQPSACGWSTGQSLTFRT